MKHARHWVLPIALSPLLAAQSAAAPQLDRSAWFARVTDELKRTEYEFRASPGGSEDTAGATWSAPNRAHELRSRISERGFSVFSRSTDAGANSAPWTVELRTARFGRPCASTLLGRPHVEVAGARAELDHGVLLEWIENRRAGLEHGWTLSERPPGTGEICIALELSGGFHFEVNADGLGGALVGPDDALELAYGGLVVFDSVGRDLAARLVPTVDGLDIRFDDAGATYPITVDPILTGPDWWAEANQAEAQCGFTVAGIGDVNGDGHGDVAISAPFYDNGMDAEGRVWVYHGYPGGLGGASWLAESNQASARFGTNVAGAGDVNGDGFDDFLVSAPFFTNGQSQEGRVWLYHGSATGLTSSIGWLGEGNQAAAWYGYGLAGVGDVNGDGFDDVLVGAPLYDVTHENEGRTWLYYGSPSGITFTAWTSDGGQPSARFGDSVAGAGDVNGDGFADLVIGAPFYDQGETDEGRASVFYGSPGGLNIFPNWAVTSNQTSAYYGARVGSAGDVNGDGYSDLFVAATHFDDSELNEGRVWVYHGSALGVAASAAWHGSSGQASAHYGRGVAGAGDVNGDGYDDLVVGAPEFDLTIGQRGRVDVHLGSPLGLIDEPSWRYNGVQGGSLFGHSVSGVGDVDADGFDDIVVGAPNHDGGHEGEGAAFLFQGNDEIGSPSCVSTNNSTGSPATIAAFSSPSAAAGMLTLRAFSVPNSPGIFYHGPNTALFPFGNGFRCVTGAVARGQVIHGSGNEATYVYNNLTPRRSLFGFTDSDRVFQYWFRDGAGGGAGFNLSNAVTVAVYP